MKMKKKIGGMLLVMCLCVLGYAGIVNAAGTTTFKCGDFLYRGIYSATITGYVGEAENVVIPEEVDGRKVEGIDKNAFNGCKTMKTLTIAKNIEWVEDEAILNCNALTKITFLGQIKEWGFHGESFMDYKTCPKVAAFEVAEPGDTMSAVDGVLYFEGTIFYPPAKKGETYQIKQSGNLREESRFAYNKYIKNLIIPAQVELCNDCISSNIKKVTYYGDIDNRIERGYYEDTEGSIFCSKKTIAYAYKYSNFADEAKYEKVKVKYIATPTVKKPTSVKVRVKKMNKKYDRVTITWRAAKSTNGCEFYNSKYPINYGSDNPSAIIKRPYKTDKKTRTYTFRLRRDRKEKITVTVRNYKMIKNTDIYSQKVKCTIRPPKHK